MSTVFSILSCLFMFTHRILKFLLWKEQKGHWRPTFLIQWELTTFLSQLLDPMAGTFRIYFLSSVPMYVEIRCNDKKKETQSKYWFYSLHLFLFQDIETGRAYKTCCLSAGIANCNTGTRRINFPSPFPLFCHTSHISSEDHLLWDFLLHTITSL